MINRRVIGSSMKRALQTLCLVAAVQGMLCAQQPSDVRSSESLLEPALQKLIVADVGHSSITGLEFKLNYEFGPAFVKRVKDSKLRCLNFMVYEKLLALEAQSIGLDRWPDVQRQVSEIEADLATEELYKDDVLARVHVSDRLIASGVASERMQLTLQWIFTPTPGEMDDYLRALRAGVPFDTLFSRQLQKGSNADDRSMSTTRFKLRMRNSFLADIVESMPAGKISLPVHGPDGWYVVKVVERKKNMVRTQTEMMKLDNDVRRVLFQHIGDSLSDEYVRTVVGTFQPTMMRGPLNALVAHLGKLYLDSARYREWKLQDRTGARRLSDVSNLEPIANDTLVTMNAGSFSVRDFLEWFRMREPYATLALSSPVSLFHSVEELVWRMVRDRLLTQRAFARGLRENPNVKRQTEWWKAKMLFTANKQRIGDTIVDSLPALRAYYDGNQRRFADEKGRVKPFDSVRTDVWREYYQQEFTAKMLHEILRLKQKYGVTINEAALGKIPVDSENDPKTIDMYPVKKGGIYPHAAFPSIDYDWQSWN
jgi:hypothetical protein